MSTKLRILHLEDNDMDAMLIHTALQRNEFRCEIDRVDTREGFVAGLERGGYDIILSDFWLPNFNGLAALELTHAKRPDVPFIFVSGTIGEDMAIDALKSGATDYVLKQRLARLVPAVHRALVDAAERLALRRAEESMIQSESKYRHLFECLGEAALLCDSRSGRVIDTNHQAEILFGRPRAEIVGSNIERLLSPQTLKEFRGHFSEGTDEAQAERVVFEGEISSTGSNIVPVAVSATPIVLYGRHLVLGLYRDVTERKRAEAEIEHLKAQLAAKGS